MFSNALLAIFLLAIVFGPALGLARYGYRRGKGAFRSTLNEIEDPAQARRRTFAIAMRLAILPAFAMLFGRIRTRVSQDRSVEPDLVWPCLIAVATLLLVLVLIPFAVGVQVGYRQALRATDHTDI